MTTDELVAWVSRLDPFYSQQIVARLRRHDALRNAVQEVIDDHWISRVEEMRDSLREAVERDGT